MPETATLVEVDFLTRQLNLQPSSRILDAPCGSGRHATEFARRGHRVTGVDISPEFLALARGRSRDLEIDWIEADLDANPDEWKARGTFDAAFCWGNSFGYLPHEKTLEWLRHTAEALRPGGRFAIETGMTAEAAFTDFHNKRAWYDVGGLLMLIENHFDVRKAQIRTEFRFIEDGAISQSTVYQHVYTAGELVRMFEGAGFSVLELTSDMAGTPFRVGASRLYLAASRE